MKVVIVGGGTAGWLTAAYFEAYNAVYKEESSFDMYYEVILVESPSVPIIGAGEGSTGVFADALRKLQKIGANEIEFLYETESTLKLGINFKNWEGDDTSYFSPITPTATHNNNVDIELYTMKMQNRTHDAAISGYLGTRGYSTFRKNYLQNIPAHAFHFDAHKVGQYLKKVSTKVGTKHIVEHISSVIKDENGNVKHIILESGKFIDGDLFIDCSGFNRVLVKEIDMGWESYAEYLPVNSALPYLHQYTENEKIMPETLAWAQKNGWMWQIPTQTRYGCGYVYCDAFVNQETALQELEIDTGRKIEPIRNIKFEVGKLKQFWKKNVVAIGLSSSFLEPLQATSIHTTLLQIQMLLNYLHPQKIKYENCTTNNYNKFISNLIDEFRDLIQIHYMTKREDTDFWKFIKYDLKRTEKTKFIIETSRHRAFSFLDFGMNHGAAGWGVWAWTLAGLDILSTEHVFQSIKKHGVKRHINDVISLVDVEFEKQKSTMLTHTDLIYALREKKFNIESFNRTMAQIYGMD